MSYYEYKKNQNQFLLYERETDICLRTDEFIMIRLDGIGFTKKYLRKFSLSEYQNYKKLIEKCVIKLFEIYTSLKLAYICTDEISLLIINRDLSSNFDNRLQKILSIIVSEITLLFQSYMKSVIPFQELEKYNEFYNSARFSAKIFNLPKELLNDYFVWRQQSANDFVSDIITTNQIIELMEKGFIYKTKSNVGVNRINLVGKNKQSIAMDVQSMISIKNSNKSSKKELREKIPNQNKQT